MPIKVQKIPTMKPTDAANRIRSPTSVMTVSGKGHNWTAISVRFTKVNEIAIKIRRMISNFLRNFTIRFLIFEAQGGASYLRAR